VSRLHWPAVILFDARWIERRKSYFNRPRFAGPQRPFLKAPTTRNSHVSCYLRASLTGYRNGETTTRLCALTGTCLSARAVLNLTSRAIPSLLARRFRIRFKPDSAVSPGHELDGENYWHADSQMLIGERWMCSTGATADTTPLCESRTP
jgi:hypothetical protein